MLSEKTRAAFRAVAKQETDAAVRRWLLLMSREDPPPRPRARRRSKRKRKRSPA